MPDLVRLSKYLSLILRHRAADFGLSLDENGFTDLEPVWTLVERHFHEQYTREHLAQIVSCDSDGKKRFKIVDGRIRAMYGHSRVNVTYPPAMPPETLYHGTSHHSLEKIRKNGLKPMKRQYVHMTDNLVRATQTGSRHDGTPVVIIIHARDAYRAGVEFHHAEKEHWLAKAIPLGFIEFPH